MLNSRAIIKIASLTEENARLSKTLKKNLEK